VTGVTLRDLREARLRCSGRFRLVPYDALAAHDKEALRSLCEGPDFFGVLIPTEGSALPMKSVSRDAALLFMALREPASLPRLLTALFGDRADEWLRPLILDGVLEVERDGNFVSGPAALPLVGDRQGADPTTRVARLSEEAIAYAAALEEVSAQELANRLYLYNTAPATAAWRRRIAGERAFDAFLLAGDGVQALLRSRWRRQTQADSWSVWSAEADAGSRPHKLYVSPAPESLPATFAIAVRAFAKTGCAYFKVGHGPAGVLRPDKLVAYFAGLDDLHRAAELIGAHSAAVAAQGVPFTAPIDREGLLSWAMDPPRFEQVLEHQQYQSWRQWLTGRLAVCVTAAREAGADVHAFVRSRIALDGVDPASWNPDLAIWRVPVGTERGAP
jgi:hypothetical protein